MLLLVRKFLIIWSLPFFFYCGSLLRLVISNAFTELGEFTGMFGLTPRLRFPPLLSSSLDAIDEGAGVCERVQKETWEDILCQGCSSCFGYLGRL